MRVGDWAAEGEMAVYIEFGEMAVSARCVGRLFILSTSLGFGHSLEGYLFGGAHPFGFR